MRRSFSDEFKRDRVREFVTGQLKVGAILAAHSLASSVFKRWREEFEAKVRKEVKNGTANSEGRALVPMSRDAELTAKQQIIARLKAGERPVKIADDMQVDVQRVYYFKKKLRKEEAAAPPPTVQQAEAPLVRTRDLIALSNSIEHDIMSEYTSGKVRELSATHLKTLMLRKMLKGEM